MRLWNYVELFWNSLDNAPSSIVLYLGMKMEVEVAVYDIRSRLTPRGTQSREFYTIHPVYLFKRKLIEIS